MPAEWKPKNRFWGHVLPHIGGFIGSIVSKNNRVHLRVDPHQPCEFHEKLFKARPTSCVAIQYCVPIRQKGTASPKTKLWIKITAEVLLHKEDFLVSISYASFWTSVASTKLHNGSLCSSDRLLSPYTENSKISFSQCKLQSLQNFRCTKCIFWFLFHIRRSEVQKPLQNCWRAHCAAQIPHFYPI